MENSSPTRIRLRILVPVALALIGSFLIADLALSFYLREEISTRLDEHQDLFVKLFEDAQAEGVALMESIAVVLGKDSRLRAALGDGDHERLAELTQEVFASLRDEGYINHMYYLDSKGRVVLRLHRPELHGDWVERSPLRKAQRTGQVSSGLELGPLGHMMLRVVVPWREGEALVGFVELGVDIDRVLDKPATELGDVVVILLSKDYLDPEQWMASRPNAATPWDTFPGTVLYRVINASLSPPLLNGLRERAEDARVRGVEVELSGHRLRSVRVPIGDAQDREVAEAVVFVDVTGLLTSAGQIEQIVAGASLVLAALVFGLIYRIMAQAERGWEHALHHLDSAHERLEARAQRRALTESQARLAEAQHIARIGSWEWRRADGTVVWSDELYRILGLEPTATRPSLGLFLAVLETGDRDRIQHQVRTLVRRRLDRLSVEVRILPPMGEGRFLLGQIYADRDARGRISRLYGTLQDITERRRTEESLERSNRALTVIRACDQALVRASSETQMLGAICKVVVQVGGYPFAWIGYAEHDRAKTVRPVAHYGAERSYLARARVSWADDELGRGPTGTAIRSGRPNVMRDALADPRFKPWREAARSSGFASSVALPLGDGKAVLGSLNIYSAAPNDFDAEEIRLLSGLAEDLSFGIRGLRSRAQLEQTHRALQLTKEHLQTLYDTAPDMIFLHAADGHILDVNQRTVETLQLDRGTIVRAGLGGFIGEGYSTDEAMERIRQTLAEGYQEFEWRVRRRDGTEFPVEVRLRRLEGREPQTQDRIIAVVRDITEQKQVEEDLAAQRAQLQVVAAQRTRELQERSRALERSEAFYRAVVEDQTELVCRFRPDGTLTFVNDAYCRYFSRGREALVGHSFMGLIPEEDRSLAERNIGQLSSGQPVAEVEHRVVLPDGSEHWLHWSDRAIFDGEGRLVECQGVGRDITASKRAEGALRIQAQELEVLNRELGAFSYSVSHDLRAPLRAIDGFSQALVEDYGDRLDATGRDYLMRVRRASQRMGELIDDLLVLSRVSRKEMRSEPVDLSMMAVEVMADLRLAEPDRVVSFHAAPGIRVRGDPKLLRIVLENLLANAWKYSRPRARARIELGEHVREGERCIYVRDNGVGFDATYVEKLFQPFQRLHRSDEFEGTGIGLATVARIVLRHGGRVWAEGVPDQGASFYFTVPGLVKSMGPTA